MLMIKSLSRAMPRNSKNEKVKKWKVAGTHGMREGGGTARRQRPQSTRRLQQTAGGGAINR